MTQEKMMTEWHKIVPAEPGKGVKFEGGPEAIRRYRAENLHRAEIADMSDAQVNWMLAREAFREAHGDDSE